MLFAVKEVEQIERKSGHQYRDDDSKTKRDIAAVLCVEDSGILRNARLRVNPRACGSCVLRGVNDGVSHRF